MDSAPSAQSLRLCTEHVRAGSVARLADTVRAAPRDLGRLGESVARRHLESLGMRMIAQNVRTRYGEVDLVCRVAGELVFVEVKTRVDGGAVAPLEAISSAKAARLIRLAEAYLMERQEAEVPWRIDVVAVLVDPTGRVIRISHVPNAVGGC